MTALTRFRNALERMLEVWVMFLISALTVIVVLAVIWRKAGASFVWYDEVGSIMLAWITYYGAALAALKRAHIGFDGILLAAAAALARSLTAVARARSSSSPSSSCSPGPAGRSSRCCRACT